MLRGLLISLAVLAPAIAHAQDETLPPAVATALAQLDASPVVGAAQPALETLSPAELDALGTAVLARVLHPHGRQSGAGPSAAYMRTARAVPQGPAIALAFLSRPFRRVPRGITPAFTYAFEAIEHHADHGAPPPDVCARLVALIQHPPAALVAGRDPALRLDELGLAASTCPSPPLREIERACRATVGTVCDTARVNAHEPTRTEELVASALSARTEPDAQRALNLWGMTASAFGRAGSRAPIDALLPMLDSPRVLHVAVMWADGATGSSATYADIGLADLYVALAVGAWHLPVSFALTPAGALSERAYSPAERDEVRRLVTARAAHP